MIKWIKKMIKDTKNNLRFGHNWKKKNCPVMYGYLFEMNRNEQERFFEKIIENNKVRTAKENESK